MASPPIVGASRARDFRTFIEIDAGQLAQLADALDAAPATFHDSQVESLAKDAFGDEEKGDLVVQVLIFYQFLTSELEITPEEVWARVRKELADLKWSEPDLNKFDSITPHLIRILKNSSLKSAVKAVSLAAERECIVSDISIITDIRPVFDDQREVIVGGLILQSLRIKSPNADRRMISFSLDADQLRNLLEQCERALRKSEVAKALFEASGSVKAIVVGDELGGAS